MEEVVVSFVFTRVRLATEGFDMGRVVLLEYGVWSMGVLPAAGGFCFGLDGSESARVQPAAGGSSLCCWTIFRVHWGCMGRLQRIKLWWNIQVVYELVW